MNLGRDDLQGLLLVRDALDADGGVIIAHLLKLLIGLDGQHNVVLVSSRHTSSHYSSVMRKLSLSVTSLAQTGRFVLLDALRCPTQPPDQMVDLRSIVTALQGAALSNSKSGRPLCILFDDLTALHCSCSELSDWPAFLHAISSLAAAGGSAGGGCCVIAHVHGDVAEDEGWINRLEHAASTVVDVESLRTGQSSEVEGRVRVFRRRLSKDGDGERRGLLGETDQCYAIGEGGSLKFFQP